MRAINNKLKFFISVFIIGLVFLVLAILDDFNLTILCFGFISTILSILKIKKFIELKKDKEKIKEYLALLNDERYKSINMHAYSATFWVGLYIEFVALCILSLFNLQIPAAVLGCAFSLRLVTYLLFNIYFSKKY